MNSEMGDLSDQIQLTPPKVRESAANVINNLLPDKSKNEYEKEYTKFTTWCSENSVQRPSENVLLAYFQEQHEKYSSSTLWKIYSMLRTTLNIHQNVDIKLFGRLQTFLKNKSKQHEPRKSKILEFEEIEKFINEAPDDFFLAIKVCYYFINYST